MRAYVTYIVPDSELSALLYTMLMNFGRIDNVVITSMETAGVLADLIWLGILWTQLDGVVLSVGRKAEKLWWHLDNDKFLHISIPLE